MATPEGFDVASPVGEGYVDEVVRKFELTQKLAGIVSEFGGPAAPEQGFGEDPQLYLRRTLKEN